MSAGGPDRHPPAEEPSGPTADDEYARAYAEGYGEGLREAFKELLQHASRGHTAQELRFLVEGRLARLSEDIERKRRSLLRPPRRPAWGALLRPPEAGEPAPTLTSALTASPLRAGESLLVREPRPDRALRRLLESASAFARVVLVSNHPPELPRRLATAPFLLSVGPASGDAGRPGLAPGEIAGRIREAAEGGSVLVYLDGFELLATEYGFETSLKFLQWLTGPSAGNAVGVIASIDPASVGATEFGRLQKAFQKVA